MKLTALTIRYIDFKRATGMRFGSEAWVLRAFCRAMGDIDINVVRPDAVLAYIAGDGPVTSFWHHKFKILLPFAHFGSSFPRIGSLVLRNKELPTVFLSHCGQLPI